MRQGGQRLDVRPEIDTKSVNLLACTRMQRKHERQFFRHAFECGHDAGEGLAIVDIRRPMERYRAVTSELLPLARWSSSPPPRPGFEFVLLPKQIVDHYMADVMNALRCVAFG